MTGPYCPIYGAGALLYLALMHFTTRPIELFFLGGIIACALEYITSYAMEKAFKARWWDYSNRALNINGRVCLIGFLAFGFFAAIFPFVHSFISGLTAKIPNLIIIILALALAGSIITDFITTTLSVLKLNKALKAYERALEKNKLVQIVRNSKKKFELRIGEMHGKAHKILSFHQRRLLSSFPNLQSEYDKALKEFKKYLKKK